MSGRVLRLRRVGVTVADLPRMQAFYEEALGFAIIATAEADPAWARLLGADIPMRTARLRLGAQEIELAAFDPPGEPYPPGSTAADLWFQHVAVVTNDMAAAYDRVMRHGGATPITEGEPDRLPPGAGGVTAYKFRDPEGHPVELIHFPPGTGDAAWQHATPGAITLGYDHSAISVADADRSVAFYAGLLGLAQASRQVNSGPAQERLDGLPGDVVDVVALQPVASPTPHIELLAYRTPRGRPAPGLRSRDVAAERLVLQVEDLAGLLETLAASGVAPAAPGLVPLADGSRAVLVHDPDRHALVLIEDAA